MIYEKKDGSFEKNDKRSTVYYGTLTVSGSGSIKIPCRGRPYEVEIWFSDPQPPPPTCGPIPVDTVDIEIDHLHPFPIWAIEISWDIQSSCVREITWRATIINKK